MWPQMRLKPSTSPLPYYLGFVCDGRVYGVIFVLYIIQNLQHNIAISTCFRYIISNSQKNGIEKNFGLGKLTAAEVEMVKNAIPELQKNIKKGEEFLEKNPVSQ